MDEKVAAKNRFRSATVAPYVLNETKIVTNREFFLKDKNCLELTEQLCFQQKSRILSRYYIELLTRFLLI